MNRKEIMIMALIILLTVAAWIVFGVYHAKTESSISQQDLRQVVPLTPTFDNDIIKKLRSREE
ncbi:hypothetical protein M1271_05265 [Patescibacteria group bacterium]|nr:hypothetical protein [Patescibacteria group bacterium]MCL5797941.1 hypothetical protein [Patescibacteria group bacterium]